MTDHIIGLLTVSHVLVLTWFAVTNGELTREDVERWARTRK